VKVVESLAMVNAATKCLILSEEAPNSFPSKRIVQLHTLQLNKRKGDGDGTFGGLAELLEGGYGLDNSVGDHTEISRFRDDCWMSGATCSPLSRLEFLAKWPK
jgi:hypothetical protein